MTNSAQQESIFEVDFRQMPDVTLFTGRKNGRKARQYFNVRSADAYRFIANDNQVITSSYFLGLIGNELIELLNTLNSNSINELLKRVHTGQLNPVSQNECVRAIKRGLSPQNDALV